MGIVITQGSNSQDQNQLAAGGGRLARFFDDANGPANVVVEPNVKLKPEHIDRSA